MKKVVPGQTSRHAFHLVLITLITFLPVPLRAGVLLVSTSEATVALAPLPKGSETCLHWSHSVTGGLVIDCFENRDAQLVLTRSFLHDFSAGLGMHPQRGTLVAAPGGGYWIEGLDMALHGNQLVLRTGGSAVRHRLVPHEGAEINLPLRTRLTLTLMPLE